MCFHFIINISNNALDIAVFAVSRYSFVIAAYRSPPQCTTLIIIPPTALAETVLSIDALFPVPYCPNIYPIQLFKPKNILPKAKTFSCDSSLGLENSLEDDNALLGELFAL